MDLAVPSCRTTSPTKGAGARCTAFERLRSFFENRTVAGPSGTSRSIHIITDLGPAHSSRAEEF